MQKIRAYNAAAAASLTDYAARALCLQRATGEQVTATLEAINLSQVFIANLDRLVAELTSKLTRKGWLWPAYQSAPSEPEPEMEAELLSATAQEAFLSIAQWPDRAQNAVAQFRDSAQEALARAEKMRDPDARRMMRELAMHYKTLALRVENSILRSSSAGDPERRQV